MASTLGVPLQVRVHTADRKGAGTDARVFIKLRDSAGTESRLTQLDNLHVDDHERNTVSEFELPASTAAALVDLDSIVLVRNAAGADGGSWLLELVEVSAGGGRWLFPVHRWLSPYTEYRISQFDSSLPQHDDPDISARRARELVDKRDQYQYAQHIAGGPVQVGHGWTDGRPAQPPQTAVQDSCGHWVPHPRLGPSQKSERSHWA
ncbi:hypothetical protein FJT64_007488 [Amphibalanus amphitrite]|uniref:PLAT domain-containing protein n=1 Tax=Amphibalanus amphitrite TaxID=1232801 RepID=A0A6A4VK94_AMPAM|nr:hypothetical protein FJT64_007488 [Amphibalanus amphitrite]